MDKIIWTYWYQGWDDAPVVPRKCVEQMQRLHPGWQIHLLDKDNVYNYINGRPINDKSEWEKLSIQAKSDLLRTRLLTKFGGVWMDPTVFCLQPLDDWLLDKMDAGLFLFHRPGADRIISSWFIASEKDNVLMQKLYNRMTNYWNKYEFRNIGRDTESNVEYWSNRIINGRSLQLSQIWFNPFFTRVLKLYPYMVYHFMFYRVIKKDKQCKQLFEKMPKISADGPHRLQRLGLLDDMKQEAKQMIVNKQTPLFKLKWNLKGKKIPDSSNLGYLFSQ